jgi:hypothetical protein
LSLAQLIEELFVNGIAVLSAEFSLEFYRHSYHGVYSYVPPQLQICARDFVNLSEFWEDVHRFFELLVLYLDRCEILPCDSQFPLSTAACACHARIGPKIDAFIAGLPVYEAITAENLASFFDLEGRVKDPKGFRERLYAGALDPAVRVRVLPFALGLHRMDSTAAERAVRDADLRSEFEILLSQSQSLLKGQREANRRVDNAFRVIVHDVVRTDRQQNAFKSMESPGPLMLTQFLQTYTVFNPRVSYLQGMNDLFVPIIFTFVPNWTENGDPVDENGAPVNLRELMPDMFWCFHAMLRNTGHFPIVASVTDACPKIAAGVHRLVSDVSPVGALWLKRMRLMDLLWCYSDLVLLFKRTIGDDVWPLWFKLNCAPVAHQWLTYFVAAILIGCFDEFAHQADIQLSAMMDMFPKIVKRMNLDRIGKIALWLYATAPLPEEPIESADEEVGNQFEFLDMPAISVRPRSSAIL